MTLPSLQWIEPVVAAARKQAGSGEGFPVVVVRVDQQRLYVWDDGKVTDVFDVSTSERGIGNQDGTYKTPLGLHRIAERFGDGVAPGTVFRARANTGEIAEILDRGGGA